MAAAAAQVPIPKVAEPEKLSGVALYSRFALAGAVCCSVTHGGLTPVDVYVFPPIPMSCDRSIACLAPLGDQLRHSALIRRNLDTLA